MHFVLFDNIKLVEGFVDSILVDTQRSRYFKINKSFANVIKRLKASSIEDIYKNGEPHEKVIVEKFVQGLIDQEFGFLTDDKKLFVHNKEVTESLFFYGEIDNSIIEIGRVLLSETKKMIEQLLYLGCRFIEIRCFETLSPKELQELFDLFHESSISSIDLYLLFDSYLIDNEFIQQFCKDNYRLNNVVIYGASFSRKIESKLFNIKYIENSISTSQCGKITSSIFSCNILFNGS